MVLLMEDSWQEARLLYALKGIPINNEMSPTIDEPSSPTTTLNNNNCYSNDAAQSLFDLYSKSKSNNEKRAYQFIKTLLQIFTK